MTTDGSILHLNQHGLVIRTTAQKGRGVYATLPLPPGTLVDISPVLLFEKEEYSQYLKHTIVDHYTFTWKRGRMALALGLGSMFNHSSSQPNVSYSLDHENNVIRFTTMRRIEPNEELCIFYGTKLWFPTNEANPTQNQQQGSEYDHAWLGLTRISSESVENSCEPFTAGDEEGGLCDEHTLEEHPPLERLKFPDEEEAESDESPLKTINVWVVEVLELQKVGVMLEFLRSNGEMFGMDSLRHLKRIRRYRDSTGALKTAMLLSEAPGDGKAPVLPIEMESFYANPAIVAVPASAAFTEVQLQRKNLLWPVNYLPMLEVGKKEKTWTRNEVIWVCKGLTTALNAAIRAQQAGEYPIAAFVQQAYEGEYLPVSHTVAPPDAHLNTKGHSSWVAVDTRISTSHPLHHACLNVIREVASSQSDDSVVPLEGLGRQAVEFALGTGPSDATAPSEKKATTYLLTSLSLFITHEPCIMCSMALLHSRVKEIFYIFPMPLTGGCGGLVKESIPGLKGTNHRFPIWRWSGDIGDFGLVSGDYSGVDGGLALSTEIDA